ncbi:fumarate reductase (quinol) flavoprotein subunit [Chromobacterium subtsugae]|uniref:Fumarate reductase flavoprotein subunit n=1 Tax=Chromobacterium subtsugae TaxID=251747 RepID=A0ABS7FC39_9NEIS|nr:MULTISPECIES: fumarate reductase (quinol) flavoprotein subunit [Chromobacterium]KUM04547.1 fumarate reductase [Chromobacterium subtsugae]KZE87116.1 fumarate reductase [Chromobacterium sp. F49]MBW7565940.1 fumarate reductase (quinol) flavoprotein subunit [Chromobacterium subtsugae]MBW8287020.1 fumarate reductase (quinol) flavoprotein subunit [Chromobacterium subtsugae]WSE93098.1 fumarate reductase (quinol) flavoprotein subunit [Chromobacterium subtsugae]
MKTYQADIAIVGAGGAGLRSAIAAAQADPGLKIALVSKVYPMRSHTVAAEGGSAAVKQDHDSFDAHFHDTVAGGDWLCEQDVVEYFVRQCPQEMVQLEHWGCPWSRKEDGSVNVRAFGGMKIERTWFAADKTGFHMLHTLFQTSIQFPQIQRFDEYFCADLIVEDGQARGVLAIEIASGESLLIEAGAVVMATGGAGRVFRENTNGGIVTGDGMALAYRHGVPLRDMEFVQYHPTCMPRTGLLFTEACRGEGGVLINKDGYRYLQDYGLGPAEDKPRNKFMELGPRDRLSQAFWHEQQKGRAAQGPWGEAVYLDLRHLGHAKLRERLPQICELAEEFLGIDPAQAPIPVRPAVHYTMGGILVDGSCASPLPGLYAVGECSSVGIHGANRLGSNSLAELAVFGKAAGEAAARFARDNPPAGRGALLEQARAAEERLLALRDRQGSERIADIRGEMAQAMEQGCGIYRTAAGMQAACDKLAELKQRFHYLNVEDKSSVWNSDWLLAIELGYQLDVAEAIAHSALQRKESRGAHQRLDGYEQRDDANFLKHSLAIHQPDAAPRIAYGAVKITTSPPGVRAYGAAGAAAERGETA